MKNTQRQAVKKPMSKLVTTTEIEFFEDTHTYLVNGVITPSVTTLIHEIWLPSMYNGISKSTLKKAASYGNKVHELIEYWNVHNDTPEDFSRKSYEGIALRRYQQLQEDNSIRALAQELPIAYIKDGIALYAGKFDFYGYVNDELTLMDYKTTATYHAQYLSYQLTLYKKALEQTYSVQIDKGACMHLPKKGYGNLLPVDFLNFEQLEKDIILHGKVNNAG